MKKIKFKKIDKIILFGGARLFSELSQYLKIHPDYELVIFSSSRHLDEEVGGGNTLREIIEKNKIKYYSSEDINKDNNLKKEITAASLGLAIGASWIFERSTVSLFRKNHLLDFMGIDLPRYDGGAHYTWKILNQSKINGANLQIIKGGEESFHRGEIIKTEEYKLSKQLKKPIDYFDFIVKKEIKFLKFFFEEVKSGKLFFLKDFDEEKMTYFPFLSTKNNGLINWSWPAKDISFFINAFDDPYFGASTFLNKKKVFLKDCYFLKPLEEYHPFCSGLVIRKNNNGIFLAALGGLLNIKQAVDIRGKTILPSIKLGSRFYTTATMLDQAMNFIAVYDAKGLKKSKKYE